jgi:hypothetical protein
MRKLLLLFCLVLGLVAAGTPTVSADHPGGATTADLRQLQRDVDLLDESLSQLDDRSPGAAEFRRREEEIRDDLTWLRGQVRRHQTDDREGLEASKDDVEALRRKIVDLRNDIEDSLGERDSRRSAAGRVNVPDGTELVVRLDEPISSQTARRDDRVEATVAEPVRVGNRIVIPTGDRVVGTVRDVEPAERPSRAGRIDLSFGTLVTDDGKRVRIPARVVSVQEDKFDEKKAGLGAIVGGILGAVIDGKQGALIGAVLGGGGAVVATKGEEVRLPAGSVLRLRLDEPVVIARGTAGS